MPADDVLVGYVRGRPNPGSRPRHAVLACFHMMIPHLMPELPAAAARSLGAKRQGRRLFITNVVMAQLAPLGRR